MRLDIN
jgi:hypothetical protein